MRHVTALLFSVTAAAIIAFNGGVSAVFGVDEEFQPYYPFFPFGKGFDYVLTDPPNYIFTSGDEDDGLFGAFLEKPFPLFHRANNQLIFISTNGYISLGDYFHSNKAEKFPVSNPIISAFHTDLKFTDNAKSHLSFGEFTEAHPQIMLHAKRELVSYGIPASFEPNHVVTVTWQKAETKNGFVTFQVVITTDGFNTYVTFNYRDMELSGDEFVPVTIGWQSDHEHFFQHKNMQLSPDSIYKPINMKGKSHNGADGKWIYHLFATKFSDANKPIVSLVNPIDKSKTCPFHTHGFCDTVTHTLTGVAEHPNLIAVCDSHDRPPVCIPCAEGHFFVEACKRCIKVLSDQLEYAENYCRENPETATLPKFDRAQRDVVCNSAMAKIFCNSNDIPYRNKSPIRFYRNFHDVTRGTFIWCWNTGSACMRCPPGTGFYESSKYYGHCTRGNTPIWFKRY